MQNIINSVKGTALGVAEYLTPVLKESKFKETGVLTPEEFVICGDHVVHHCPTWRWCGGEPSKAKPYLPLDKQYLITEKVPCSKRYKQQMDNSSQHELLVEADGDDEGWLDTHHYDKESGINKKVIEMGIDDKVCSKEAEIEVNFTNDEPMDLEAYEAAGMLDSEANTVFYNPTEEETAEFIQTRKYDLHITYDKYYQTPRLWITGYSESDTPLTVEEMYEDFSQDHANKTITMESHPHMSTTLLASVHPCKHAETMKKLFDTIVDGGRDIGVHLYLIIFLKFVQAIIPTVEYDFTFSV